MENGKKIGKWKQYYSQGSLKSTGYYNKNKKDKEWTLFYPSEYGSNKKIKSKVLYKNGKMNGNYIEYYQNGNKRSEGMVLLSAMHGKWTFWYHSGKKELECEFEHGTSVGIAKIYHDNGTVKQVVRF